MAITITKKVEATEEAPAQTKTDQVVEVMGITDLVDLFVERQEYATRVSMEYKAAQKDLSEVQDIMLEVYNTLYDDHDDIEFTIEGEQHAVQFGPKHHSKASIHKSDAVKKLMISMLEEIKTGLFTDLATVSISDLRKHLTEDQLAQILVSKKTDKRTLKVIK